MPDGHTDSQPDFIKSTTSKKGWGVGEEGVGGTERKKGKRGGEEGRTCKGQGQFGKGDGNMNVGKWGGIKKKKAG